MVLKYSTTGTARKRGGRDSTECFVRFNFAVLFDFSGWVVFSRSCFPSYWIALFYLFKLVFVSFLFGKVFVELSVLYRLPMVLYGCCFDIV